MELAPEKFMDDRQYLQLTNRLQDCTLLLNLKKSMLKRLAGGRYNLAIPELNDFLKHGERWIKIDYSTAKSRGESKSLPLVAIWKNSKGWTESYIKKMIQKQ